MCTFVRCELLFVGKQTEGKTRERKRRSRAATSEKFVEKANLVRFVKNGRSCDQVWRVFHGVQRTGESR
jgi:hypothetical protein